MKILLELIKDTQLLSLDEKDSLEYIKQKTGDFKNKN